MPVTTGGAIRAAILPVIPRVYRDRAPDDEVFPYVTFLDDVSINPALRGDARTRAWGSLVQVDVWQRAVDVDFTLVNRVVEAIDGAALPDAMLRAYVQDYRQVPEDVDTGIVHHAITVRAVTLVG